MIMKNFLITIFNYKNIDHDLLFSPFTFDLCLNCFLYIRDVRKKFLFLLTGEFLTENYFFWWSNFIFFGDERLMGGRIGFMVWGVEINITPESLNLTGKLIYLKRGKFYEHKRVFLSMIFHQRGSLQKIISHFLFIKEKKKTSGIALPKIK